MQRSATSRNEKESGRKGRLRNLKAIPVSNRDKLGQASPKRTGPDSVGSNLPMTASTVLDSIPSPVLTKELPDSTSARQARTAPESQAPGGPSESSAEINTKDSLCWCNSALTSFTNKTAESDRDKLGMGGPFNPIVRLFARTKGIDKAKASQLVKDVGSIGNGVDTQEGLLVVVSSFPDFVVERYSDKLTNDEKALKIFREEYKSSPEESRKEFYVSAKGMGSQTTAEEIARLVAPSQEQGRLQFPMLSFYSLLLSSYDKKYPPDDGLGLERQFLLKMSLFLSVSSQIASSSASFDEFDSRMKDLGPTSLYVVDNKP